MASYNRRFFIGNVVEDPSGYKWIVSRVTDDNVEAVSFDSESVLTVQQLEDHKETRTCYECDYDHNCEHCNGMGYTTIEVKGWQQHAKVLAVNVKEFILQGVRRTWGI
jgi:hypothetical protein